MRRTRRFRTDGYAARVLGQERRCDKAPAGSYARACLSPRVGALHFNNRPLVQKPHAQLRRVCVFKSRPPTTTPWGVPSASRQTAPAGPTRVPAGCVRHVWSVIRLAPTGPANGPTESPLTVAARVSAELVDAPAYMPPTASTVCPRSSSANWDRPAGSSVGPDPHAPMKNPESRLTAAVSPVTRREVPGSRPPPGGTLSATPPIVIARPSRTSPLP